MAPAPFNSANTALAFIGFGEAAQAFVEGMGAAPTTAWRGFDIKTLSDDRATRVGKRTDFQSFNVDPASSARSALIGADAVLSLVTADQALAAALSAAEFIAPGAFYFDANSVSPQTKRAAAEAIEGAGGAYVDVAVMSPVRPALTAAPLLVSGPHGEAGAGVLRGLGFTKVRVLEGPVGAASAVKMIRSVMIKGVEALTAECLMAAVAAGVDGEVIASLDASDPTNAWSARGDYSLDRMLIHGARRAEEMREVVVTLEGLGVTPAMSRGTVAWQAALGAAGLNPPPSGYRGKIEAVTRAGAQP